MNNYFDKIINACRTRPQSFEVYVARENGRNDGVNCFFSAEDTGSEYKSDEAGQILFEKSRVPDTLKICFDLTEDFEDGIERRHKRRYTKGR